MAKLPEIQTIKVKMNVKQVKRDLIEINSLLTKANKLIEKIGKSSIIIKVD